MTQPTPRHIAVAKARQAAHESLVGLSAWAADDARKRIAELESAVRTSTLLDAAEMLINGNPDRCPDFSDGVDWAHDALLNTASRPSGDR